MLTTWPWNNGHDWHHIDKSLCFGCSKFTWKVQEAPARISLPNNTSWLSQKLTQIAECTILRAVVTLSCISGKVLLRAKLKARGAWLCAYLDESSSFWSRFRFAPPLFLFGSDIEPFISFFLSFGWPRENPSFCCVIFWGLFLAFPSLRGAFWPVSVCMKFRDHKNARHTMHQISWLFLQADSGHTTLSIIMKIASAVHIFKITKFGDVRENRTCFDLSAKGGPDVALIATAFGFALHVSCLIFCGWTL